MTVEVPELEVGRHECPLCPGRFDTVGDKRRHLRADHPTTKSKRGSR